MDRRRESRLFVEVPGSYDEGGVQRAIVFSAISANGCRLSHVARDLAIGDAIALSLGPIGPIAATIRWRHDTSAGVQFQEPLDPALVEYFAGFCGAAA